MKVEQKGFTLIELIVVIVILGILAATALPKFIDLRGDAAQAAVDGAAGALSSAASLNYATFQISAARAENLGGNNACAQLAGSALPGIGLTGGLAAAHVQITADVDCTAPAPGVDVTCTLQSTDDGSRTAQATIICTQ